MKVLTFAAGLAAGYVLGTRAGREKFDQIVTSARKMSNHPTVVQAQDKVKDMLGSESRRQPAMPTTSSTSTTPTTSTTPATSTTPTTDSTTTPAASTARTKSSAVRTTASSNTGPTVAAGGAPKPLTQ